MRWLVEVSALGNTDTQKFCVEAESWQRALQAARSQRGEHSPMSGFSIELLEEGYRAVDPVARVRFVVRRAPDDMALTQLERPWSTTAKGVVPAPPAPAAAASVVVAVAMKSAPAPSRSSADQPVPNLAPAPGSSSAGAATAGRASSGATKAAPVAAPRPGHSPPPAANVAVAEKPVERAALPAIGSSIPGLPAVKLLTSREQNPNDASPLTYREYAFAVPEGTTEEAAMDVLRAQLGYVEAHISTAQMGKLVNLACFDVEFSGKAPRPPLATLTWKDWKGDPVLAYPRRGETSSKPPRPPSKMPPSLAAGALAQASAPVVVPAAAPVPQGIAAPNAQAAQRSARPGAPPLALQSIAPPPEPTFTEAESRNNNPAQPPLGSAMVRTPSGRFVRGRVSGDELITSLFEAMHDLHFLRDALDGGQFCLALATEVLPARAAIIHFFDIEEREWVVACTRGKETQRLLTMRSPEGDEILREAARKRRAIVVPNASNASADRYRQVGGGRSLIVAPIMQAGRALGALEIINPLDGMPFTEDEGNAMTYIAEQFAEYLGSRGIVLDGERIHSAAAAR